jgi:hypothetical protein
MVLPLFGFGLDLAVDAVAFVAAQHIAAPKGERRKKKR